MIEWVLGVQVYNLVSVYVPPQLAKPTLETVKSLVVGRPPGSTVKWGDFNTMMVPILDSTGAGAASMGKQMGLSD